MRILKFIILFLSISTLAYASPILTTGYIPVTNTVTPTTLQNSDIQDLNGIVTVGVSVTLTTLHSSTGTRFLCVNSIGSVSASASACSGT